MNPRYDRSLNVGRLFPSRPDGTCSCGCGVPLQGRQKRWSSAECANKSVELMRVRKGCVPTIRRLLWDRDGGVCARCKEPSATWEADHITAVVNGGGGCDLSGYQTLCVPCHRIKTNEDLHERPCEPELRTLLAASRGTGEIYTFTNP